MSRGAIFRYFEADVSDVGVEEDISAEEADEPGVDDVSIVTMILNKRRQRCPLKRSQALWACDNLCGQYQRHCWCVGAYCCQVEGLIGYPLYDICMEMPGVI